jgi:hypothetical protein
MAASRLSDWHHCAKRTMPAKLPGETIMNDERNPLAVLKSELAFLEDGGYRRSAEADWRPHFVFQDSPICLNFDRKQPTRPCSECILARFVPAEFRNKKVPCRHIPLNNRGETVELLYKCGTHEDLEVAIRQWLQTTIQSLETEARKEQGAAAEA